MVPLRGNAAGAIVTKIWKCCGSWLQLVRVIKEIDSKPNKNEVLRCVAPGNSNRGGNFSSLFIVLVKAKIDMLDSNSTRSSPTPEIGLEEFKTHAYLLNVIGKLTAGMILFRSSYLWTGILGLACRKSARTHHCWVRTDAERSAYRWTNRPSFCLLTQTACMLVDTIFMTIALWKSRTCSRKTNPKTISSSLPPKPRKTPAACSCMKTMPLATGCLNNFYGLHVRPDLKLDKFRPTIYTLLQELAKSRFVSRQGGHAAFHIKQTTPGCS